MRNSGWPSVINAAQDSPLVLHVRSSGGLFGADRVVLDLCETLPSAGYRCLLVPLIEPDGSGTELMKEAEARGIPVSPLRLKKSMDFAALRGLCIMARETGATHLHGHDYKSDIALLLAGKARKRFATLHGRVGASPMLRLKEFLDRFVVNRFNRVICVSHGQAVAEKKRGVRKISVVQNGIDPRPFRKSPPELNALKSALGLEPEDLVVGAVGRLSEEKGYDFLLRVCARVLKSGRNFKILLVGDGPQMRPLRELSRELGLEKQLLLPGFRGDTVSLHRILDVFCMPSRHEGLPLSLLESMASGRAVVANAVGGIPEVLGVDGTCGLLMTPNDEEGWVSTLEGLLRDPERRAALGAAAAQKVEACFSRESMAGGVAHVYAGMDS